MGTAAEARAPGGLRCRPAAAGAAEAPAAPPLPEAADAGACLARPVHLRARLVAVDAFAVVAAWGVVGVVRTLRGSPPDRTTALHGFAVLVVVLCGFAVAQLYRSLVGSQMRAALPRVVVVVAAAHALVISFDPDGSAGLSTRALLASGAATIVAVVLGRDAFEQWLAIGRRHGRHGRAVVLVGTPSEQRDLHDLLETHPEAGYRALGAVDPARIRRANRGRTNGAGPAGAEIGEEVERVALAVGASGILVCANGLAPTELNAVLRRAHGLGLHVHLSNGLHGIDASRLVRLPLAHEPLLYVKPRSPGRGAAVAKRVVDLVVGALLLVVVAPVLAVAAVAIRLDDGGPVVFRQRRIGRDGVPFEVLKLRTMSLGAERALDDLRAQNERSGGPLFKLTEDPRVTRVGRVLRRTDIDELPQLVNVLRGDLSLVGPRPALPSEVAQFDEELCRRHEIRPGLTGLWQVEARRNPAFGAYRRLDLFYVDNWSVGLDLLLMLATVRVIVLDVAHGASRSWIGRIGTGRP